MAVIVNGDGILTGISSLATDLTDITSGRGTITGVTTVGTLQLGAGVSISSPRSQNAAIFTNNTEFLTVDDAGRVGIAITNPTTKFDVNGTSKFQDDVTFAGAAANITFDKSEDDLVFGDNAKAVFGASSDLKIYHDSGSGQSLIEESGPSVLKLKASDFRISNTANSADYLQANDGSYLRLYHNGTIRLETTTTGVDVTSLNVTGISTVKSEVNATGVGDPIVEIRNSRVNTGTGAAGLRFITNEISGSNQYARAQISAEYDGANNVSGRLIFSTTNGSGTLTERLRVDDDGKVGVNITPTGQFTVKNTDDSNINVFEVYNDNGNMSGSFSQSSAGDGTVGVRKNDGSLTAFFRSNGISYLTGGEFGINTTTPVEKLGISGNMRFVNPNDNTSRITALPSGSYNVGNSGGSAIAFHRFADGGGGSDEIFFETHHQGNFHGETLRIEKSGDIKVKRGDLYFETAGKGIVLGATSNVDANTLDDYEEGTFTPTYDGTWTNISNSNLRQAKYTKIGNTVHVWMEYFMTGNNGAIAQNSNIRGFPFTGTSNPADLYPPANVALMYGPTGYAMDETAAGRAYITIYDDRLYFSMGSKSGIRHIWVQLTYPTNY